MSRCSCCKILRPLGGDLLLGTQLKGLAALFAIALVIGFFVSMARMQKEGYEDISNRQVSELAKLAYSFFYVFACVLPIAAYIFFGPFVVTHFGFSGIKTFFVYMGIMGLSIIPIIFVAYLKNNPLKFGRQTTQKRNTQNKDSRTPMYDHGQDSNLDEAKVVMDLLKSAKGGNADAQTQMGLRCLHGDGVPKDWNKSVEWYNKSARQGNIMALNTLAYII